MPKTNRLALGPKTINIFGYLTTLTSIPNEVPIENDGLYQRLNY